MAALWWDTVTPWQCAGLLLTVALTVLYATAFLLLLQFLVDPVVARFHRTQLGLCSTGPDVALQCSSARPYRGLLVLLTVDALSLVRGRGGTLTSFAVTALAGLSTVGTYSGFHCCAQQFLVP